jgi:hypothetical protein
MTVDEFTGIFKQCPVCLSPVSLDAEVPSFVCQGYDACFGAFPEIHDTTKIAIIYLYGKSYYYHYIDGMMSVFPEDDVDNEDPPAPIAEIICDDKLMFRLFSNPKNIQKYFLVS